VDLIAPFRISICGIEELVAHCGTDVSHVLSILDPDWPIPEALDNLGKPTRLELRFHDVIQQYGTDVTVPQRHHVAKLLAFGRDLLAEPTGDAHLLVHCHAGISRSTASVALILAQALPDISAKRILGEVLRIRPQAWPNLRIIEMGDAQLDRRGELIVATGGLYRTQLNRQPHLAEQMRSGGRDREIAAAAQKSEGRPTDSVLEGCRVERSAAGASQSGIADLSTNARRY
jgi:predicted protein tyrosine phosphatase